MTKKADTTVETPAKETLENAEEPVEMTLEELQGMLGSAPSQNLTYGVSEALWLTDLDERRLYICESIDEDIFRKINYFILLWNKEDFGIPVDKRLPIKIIINSGGGNVYCGLSTIESIRSSVTPVYGYCIGYAFSMAFHIFTSCHKRYATKTSMFLNHEGEYGDINSPNKVKDCFTFYEKVNDRLRSYIAQNTKLTKKQLEDNDRIETYFFGDEAKEMGVVTDLIGLDCQLDEVL